MVSIYICIDFCVLVSRLHCDPLISTKCKMIWAGVGIFCRNVLKCHQFTKLSAKLLNWTTTYALTAAAIHFRI